MIKNYFKAAVRNIRRNKMYAGINVFGLAIAMALVGIIYLYIQDELSYDKHINNIDLVYTIEMWEYENGKSNTDFSGNWQKNPEERGIDKDVISPLGYAYKLLEEVPVIEAASHYSQGQLLIKQNDDQFTEQAMLVDSGFFSIFEYPFLHGNPKTALADKYDIVISKKLAEKLFDNTALALGKTIQADYGSEPLSFTIKGVLAPLPANTSVKEDAYIRHELRGYFEEMLNNWDSFNCLTFIRIKPGTYEQAIAGVGAVHGSMYKENDDETRKDLGLEEDEIISESKLLPMKNIHFQKDVGWFPTGDPLYTQVLALIVLLILIIACINYTVLTLSNASGRMREVMVRKVMGATKAQLAVQFMAETILLTFVAMVLGLTLIQLILPYFNKLASKQLEFNLVAQPLMWIVALCLMLFTGVLAGLYPALVLARFKNIAWLKTNSTYRYKPVVAKVLVVFQFTLCLFFIICTTIMRQQLNYVANKDLGFDASAVVVLPTYTGWSNAGYTLLETVQTEAQKSKYVQSVAGSSMTFTQGWSRNSWQSDEDGEKERYSYIYAVSDNYLETMGIDLVEGRSFTRTEYLNSPVIVVNRAFEEMMDWEAGTGLGKACHWGDGPSEVIGIIEDLHFRSLESPIEPVLFTVDSTNGKFTRLNFRIDGQHIPEAIDEIKAIWQKVNPDKPFSYKFLDEIIATNYKKYERWTTIVTYATFIGILIACLGLFGLSGITTLNKVKEIGIRKVMGAETSGLMFYLSKDVLVLSVLALVLASPIAWFIMEEWLTSFAYAIPLGIQYFLFAGLLGVVIATATVSYHSWKAANVNPIKSLRNE